MRLAYFALQFPKLRETFVYNEVNEIRRNDIDVRVFSVLKPWEDKLLVKGYVISEEARHWLDETCYTPKVLSLPMLLANLRTILRHPLRYTKTKVWLLTRRQPSLRAWLKTVKFLMSAGYFADELERSGGADHMHAHFSHGAALTALVVSRLTGISWSFTSVAVDIYVEPHLLEEKLQQADFSVTISEYNLRTLRERYPAARDRHIEVIPHSVDTEHHRPRNTPVNNSPPRILSVGALFEFKGFPWLIDACALLKERGVPFICDIIGEGPMGDELSARVRDKQVEDCVNLRGALPQEEVVRFYENADLFCLASVIASNNQRDGIPLVIMESMARGLPVVSTNISGIPEGVDEGVNGYLVEPRNAEQLADKLEVLLTDRQLRERMGGEGRRIAVERFNLKTNIGRLVDCFQRQVETRQHKN